MVTLRRSLATAAKAIGLLLGAALVATAVYTFASTPAGSSLPPPQPTSHPRAPGIEVAAQQPLDLPDPMLVTDGDAYHMYLSTAFLDPSHVNVPEEIGGPGRWGPVVEALPRLPSWSQSGGEENKVWAPYVQKLGNRWLMYFSTQINEPGPRTHCIGVASSRDATGPFVPVGSQPMVCQRAEGGDIDAQPFFDPTGPGGKAHPWYLIWKSDGNNLSPHRPTLIWAASMSNDGTTVTGTPTVIFRATLAWEKPVLEAPQLVRSPDGREWLFFSAGAGFYTDRYAMGVAACDGPLAGCHETTGRPLVSTNDQGIAPGEETVFIAPDHSYWLLYNPWHTGFIYEPARPAEAARIGWSAQGPYVAEAGQFPAPPATHRRVGHARIG